MRSRTDLLTATLATASCVGLVEAVAGVGFGLWFVADDLQERTDEFDGLGVAIGLFLTVPAVLVVLLLGAALWLLRRRSTRTAAVLASLVGLVGALVLLPTIGGGGGSLLGFVVGLTGLALLAPGLALALRRDGLSQTA